MSFKTKFCRPVLPCLLVYLANGEKLSDTKLCPRSWEGEQLVGENVSDNFFFVVCAPPFVDFDFIQKSFHGIPVVQFFFNVYILESLHQYNIDSDVPTNFRMCFYFDLKGYK